jgi:hypothetical protein
VVVTDINPRWLDADLPKVRELFAPADQRPTPGIEDGVNHQHPAAER